MRGMGLDTGIKLPNGEYANCHYVPSVIPYGIKLRIGFEQFSRQIKIVRTVRLCLFLPP